MTRYGISRSPTSGIGQETPAPSSPDSQHLGARSYEVPLPRIESTIRAISVFADDPRNISAYPPISVDRPALRRVRGEYRALRSPATNCRERSARTSPATKFDGGISRSRKYRTRQSIGARCAPPASSDSATSSRIDRFSAIKGISASQLLSGDLPQNPLKPPLSSTFPISRR